MNLIPVECFFLDDVNKTQKKNTHKNKHLNKALEAEFSKINCPRVHKNNLDIKYDEQNGH